MNATKRRLVLLMALALLGRSRVARGEAPSGSAEQMFREGRAALTEENYELARSRFDQSYQMDPTLGTLLNLAVCEEKLGMLHAALVHLQEALDKANLEDQRRPLIVQRIARLDARTPRLTIRPSRPFEPGVSISLDAKPLGSVDIGRMLRVDPGTHVLDCAGPNGERCTIVFTMEEGQESTQMPALSASRAPTLLPIALANESAVAVQQVPTPKRRAGAEQRNFALAAGGFGFASIAAGLIAGVGVLQQKGLVAEHCDERGCDQQGMAAGQRGKTLAVVSTVVTGVGVVVMGASVYFLLSAPSGSDSAASLSLAGSF